MNPALPRDPAYYRLADGARILAVLIVGVPILVDQGSDAITALFTAGLIWLAAAVAIVAARLSPPWCRATIDICLVMSAPPMTSLWANGR